MNIKSTGFSRQQRIRKKNDFQTLFNQPYRTGSENFLALWKKGKFSFARIGIITAKKIAKKAVDRNKIRRVIRESFRLAKNQLNNIDLIIIARHECGKLDQIALRKETDHLWKKLQQHYQKHFPSF